MLTDYRDDALTNGKPYWGAIAAGGRSQDPKSSRAAVKLVGAGSGAGGALRNEVSDRCVRGWFDAKRNRLLPLHDAGQQVLHDRGQHDHENRQWLIA